MKWYEYGNRIKIVENLTSELTSIGCGSGTEGLDIRRSVNFFLEKYIDKICNLIQFSGHPQISRLRYTQKAKLTYIKALYSEKLKIRSCGLQSGNVT